MIAESKHNLPDKLYFRIGEVSDLVRVKPYVLRYWETEFPDIKPTKSKSGQRLYKRKDVELLLSIKELLYKERFTINGAKQRLKELVKHGRPAEQQEPRQATLYDKVESGASACHKETKAAASQTDKKFLQKVKNDLEWCLSEIRSG